MVIISLTKKITSIFLALVIIISVFIVPTMAADTQSTSDEKVLKISWGTSGGDWGFPSPLAFYPRGPGYTMMSFCFDTLVWPDSTGDFTGLLAKSWEQSADGLTWTFHLRDNVTWHDGEHFSTNDVKFTYDYLSNKSIISASGSSWYDLSMIQNVTVIDETTIQMKLNKPYSPFISLVAAVVPIMPQHIWQNVTDPAKYTDAKAAIGTGPFKLVDYNSQQQTYKYVANADYYLGKPVIDTLMYVPSSDNVLSLKTGDIDEGGVTLDQVQALNDSSNIKVVSGDGYWCYRLRFNIPNNTLLNNLTVRKAMYYSLNCSDILDKVLHGGGITGNPGFVPQYSKWYDSSVTQYPYDVDKANQLLDQAGFSKKDSDGIRLTQDGKRLEFQLLCTTEQQSQRMAELVQSYFKAAGIGIILKPTDQKTADGLVTAGNYEITIYGTGIGTDPAKILDNIQSSTGWNNTAYKALAKQEVSAANDSARRAIVNQLQAMIADNVPTIPVLYRNVYSASNSDKFEGFFFTPGGIGGGVPTEYNKLVFVQGTWKEGSTAASSSAPSFLAGIAAIGMVAVVMLTLNRKKK